jgi:hypothetical protein
MKRGRSDLDEWPAFDAPLLRAVAEAFLRRRRAIRYQAGLSCEREFNEGPDGSAERLNLDLCLGRSSMRLSVWEDGGMWLRLCVPGPGRECGWVFLDQFHGDICDVSPAALVGMVEATIAKPFQAEKSHPLSYREWLRMIWGRVGPSTS